MLALSLLGLFVWLRRFVRSRPRHYGQLFLACSLFGLFAELPAMPSAHRQYYLMALPMICLSAAEGLFVLRAWVTERARDPGRKSLLMLAPVVLAAFAVWGLVDSFMSGNQRQFSKLREVFEKTKPTDLVMDGWEGMGVFRPHAFHYFFLHDETMQMFPRERLDAYLDSLENGAPRPRVIAMDKHLAALGPRFMKLVESGYTTQDGFLYFSKNSID